MTVPMVLMAGLLIANTGQALGLVIAGRVVDERAATPIPRALVKISGPGVPAAANVVLTDDDGRFTSTGLVTGSYRLVVEKAGYIGTDTSAALVTLDAASIQRNVTLTLRRGAAVDGFVVDEYGDAVVNLTVELKPAVDGFHRASARLSAVTDDRGYYRIWGVPDGRYVLLALLPQLDLLRNAADIVPAPTYYPGVLARSRAETITVATNDLEGLNFTARFARHSAVTIAVLGSWGRPPADAEVWVAASDDPQSPAIGASPSSIGQFAVSKLAPGEYDVVAVARVQNEGLESSRQRFSVAGDGTTVSISMTTERVARLSGSIAIAKDASGIRPATPVVSIEPAVGRALSTIASDRFRASAALDQPFTVAAPPGLGLVRVSGLPSGWAVISIEAGGADMTDRVIRFASGQSIDDIRIVISDRLGTVNGIVSDVDPSDPPVAVVLSRDRERWTRGTRSMLTARTGSDGRFRIAGVRPGEYLAVAINARDIDLLDDRDRVEVLFRAAMPISVTAAEVPVTLRMSR